MKEKRVSIVITTINRPIVLEAIASNCRKFGRIENVDVIVVGDRNTPTDVSTYVESVFKQTSLSVKYWGVEKQLLWLDKFPQLNEIIPFNSDNRRNIGHLLAYENGADIIVALDDDNYPLENIDYIAPYLEVGTEKPYPLTSSKNGWYNICSSLSSDCNFEFYPRGFPYSRRTNPSEPNRCLSTTTKSSHLLVKAGLWLGDPDIDAVTRLTFPMTVDSFSGGDVFLAPGTMCPFNTQNTAFHRNLLPAFYYVHMNRLIDGYRVDRYGDIWSGYIAQTIMHHFGDIVGFGYPLVNHERNEHNLLEDLRQEFPGMVLTNKLIGLMKEVSIQGTNYHDATQSFAIGLRQVVNYSSSLTNQEKDYLLEVVRNILIWLDVVERLDNQ